MGKAQINKIQLFASMNSVEEKVKTIQGSPMRKAHTGGYGNTKGRSLYYIQLLQQYNGARSTAMSQGCGEDLCQTSERMTGTYKVPYLGEAGFWRH